MVSMLASTLAITTASACATYTPGFWKHNIGVYLGENPGNYSAFDDGTKVDGATLEALEALIPGDLANAYADLTAKGPGSNVIRDAMADLLNAALASL